MRRVAIIDYGMGNLDSVSRAVEECGGQPVITGKAAEIKTASYIILPGVGVFAEGMRNIRQSGLDKVLNEQVLENKIPFLGICLGMQFLATRGLEGGETAGLGWIKGEVVRFKPADPKLRLPHIGWNEVCPTQPCLLLDHILPGKDFYFVHSYHFVCRDRTDVYAVTDYGGAINSIISREHIFGVQFHPEKSQKVGFQLLKNFLNFHQPC